MALPRPSTNSKPLCFLMLESGPRGEVTKQRHQGFSARFVSFKRLGGNGLVSPKTRPSRNMPCRKQVKGRRAAVHTHVREAVRLRGRVDRHDAGAHGTVRAGSGAGAGRRAQVLRLREQARHGTRGLCFCVLKARLVEHGERVAVLGLAATGLWHVLRHISQQRDASR